MAVTDAVVESVSTIVIAQESALDTKTSEIELSATVIAAASVAVIVPALALVSVIVTATGSFVMTVLEEELESAMDTAVVSEADTVVVPLTCTFDASPIVIAIDSEPGKLEIWLREDTSAIVMADVSVLVEDRFDALESVIVTAVVSDAVIVPETALVSAIVTAIDSEADAPAVVTSVSTIVMADVSDALRENPPDVCTLLESAILTAHVSVALKA